LSRFEPNLVALGEKRWAQFYSKVQEISPDRLPDNDSLKAELNRLDRATEFISSAVVTVHPFAELMNPDIQNHVTNFENRLSQLQSAQPEQLPKLVSNLNNDVTAILDRLSPYLSNTESARAAGQAFGRYKRLVEAQEKEIRKIKATIDEASKSIQSTKDAAETYRIELLEGTEEKKSIQSEIHERASHIDKMLSATESFYRKLTEGDAESASIENKIVEARASAVANSDEITKKLTAAKNMLTDLDRIHSEVMGANADTDGDTNERGLKAQLEARTTQLDNLVSEFEQKFSGVQEQIEGLLPGATSAGLATAYNNRRIKAERDARFYSRAFFVGICLLALSAAATVTQSFSLQTLSWELISFASAKEYLDKLLFKLPIVIPILWATLTVSKRRSEMHRLAEEYAHKEALAQSYEGFKQQITEMGKDDEPLIRDLLEVILKAISINAATTLEGKHGEKMPIQEAIEEAMRTVTQGNIGK